MKQKDSENQLNLIDTSHPGDFDFGNGYLINKIVLEEYLNISQ